MIKYLKIFFNQETKVGLSSFATEKISEDSHYEDFFKNFNSTAKFFTNYEKNILLL